MSGNFSDIATGETDIIYSVRKYTDHVKGVHSLLYNVYPMVKHKSIKNRCKKVQRKIKKR